jgi:hypothetical protein
LELAKFLGQEVRVVEEQAGRVCFGHSGEVKDLKMQVGVWKLNVMGQTGGWILVEPEHCCRSAAFKKAVPQSLVQLSRLEKQVWLAEAGRDLDQPQLSQEAWVATEKSACSEHLQYYVRLLRWSFKVPEVQLLQPELVGLLFNLETSEESSERQKYLKCLQEIYKKSRLLLVSS